MIISLSKLSVFALLLVSSLLVQTPAQTISTTPSSPQKRMFRLNEEFLNKKNVSQFALSPDGQAIAFVLDREPRTLPLAAFSDLRAEGDTGDIYVQVHPRAPLKNLTQGGKDNTGFFQPRWSPDGKLLAFLGTRGKGGLTIWIWDREKNAVRQTSQQGIVVPGRRGIEAFRWLDERRIFTTVPVGATETTMYHPWNGIGAQQAMAAWAKNLRGEVSVSVVDSHKFVYPPRNLYVLDALTGAGSRIAISAERHWNTPDWWPSPSGRHIALMAAVASEYNTVSRSKIGHPGTLEIRTMDGEPLKLDNPMPMNVHAQTLAWRPNGHELAFFANGEGPVNPTLMYGTAAAEVMPESEKASKSMKNPARLYRVNVEKHTIEEVPTGDIELGPLGSPGFEWTASGELIFLAPRREYSVPGGSTPPSRVYSYGPKRLGGDAGGVAVYPAPTLKWWVLDRSGVSRPLVRGEVKLPATMQSVKGGERFVGLLDGEILEVDPVNGEVRNLTEKFAEKVTEFQLDDALKTGKILLTTMVKGQTDYYIMDLETLSATSIEKPTEVAKLAAFGSGGGLLFSASGSLNNPGGDVYWRIDPAGKLAEKILELNDNQAARQLPEQRIIKYTSLNGESLNAILVLPYGYKPGRRYPLHVEVRTQVRVQENDDFRLFADPYAQLGYAVLRPSIPQNIPGMGNTMGGEEGESCINQLNGVIPSIEEVIRMGIADPDRLFVGGSSRGGWTTMCLVGTTTRFKAAVAWVSGDTGSPFSRSAGMPREPAKRYSDNPYDYTSPAGGAIAAGYRPSDTPWWRDLNRQQRNNPLSYVDRVQTPMLIVTADFDFLNQFSEDYFNALVSMRKTARLVRYWGANHGFRNNNYFRDYLMRVFAWTDEWGDIARDKDGNIIWDGDRAASRKGAAPLEPEAFGKFDLFQPSPTRP